MNEYFEDISQRIINHNFPPFYLDWEEYRIHYKITQSPEQGVLYEHKMAGFYFYKISGFITKNNDLTGELLQNFVMMDDSDGPGKIIHIIDHELYDGIFKLFGAQNYSFCTECLTEEHNIENEILPNQFPG